MYRQRNMVSLSSDKCTYCKSLWRIASADCFECKNRMGGAGVLRHERPATCKTSDCLVQCMALTQRLCVYGSPQAVADVAEAGFHTRGIILSPCKTMAPVEA